MFGIRKLFVYTFNRDDGSPSRRPVAEPSQQLSDATLSPSSGRVRDGFLRGLHAELWPLGFLSIGLYMMVALLVPLYARTLGIASLQIGLLAGAGSLLPM